MLASLAVATVVVGRAAAVASSPSNTEKAPAVPVLADRSCRRYWATPFASVPAVILVAVTPVPPPLIAATTSSRFEDSAWTVVLFAVVPLPVVIVMAGVAEEVSG